MEMPLWTMIPGMIIGSLLLIVIDNMQGTPWRIFESFEWWIIFNILWAVMILIVNFIWDQIIKRT